MFLSPVCRTGLMPPQEIYRTPVRVVGFPECRADYPDNPVSPADLQGEIPAPFSSDLKRFNFFMECVIVGDLAVCM